MARSFLAFGLTLFVAIFVSARPAAAISIALNAVIGAPGTNASTVDGAGLPVNLAGPISNSGATTLTAAGSGAPAPVTFNFNSGFADSFDRVVAFAPSDNAVYADRKSNSASPAPLIFDRDDDADYGDETDDVLSDPNTFHEGFGMHGEMFITFDLDVIRAASGLTGEDLILAGEAGVVDYLLAEQTSGAIFLDGAELAVFDWNNGTAPQSTYDQYDVFSLFISSTARYLSFAGMSGLDLNIGGAHVGFGNVTLSEVPPVVPEPSAGLLLILGCAALGLHRRRR